MHDTKHLDVRQDIDVRVRIATNDYIFGIHEKASIRIKIKNHYGRKV